jgi:hypothetical protein
MMHRDLIRLPPPPDTTSVVGGRDGTTHASRRRIMTERKYGIRELTADELLAVSGGADLHNSVAMQPWVSPLAIHGFNPQPDPPARIVIG